MDHIFFRITDSAIPDGLYASLKTKGLIFLVKEIGTETKKPHFQGIIFCNKNTLRNLLKAYYTGNEGYSTKVIKDGNVLRTVQYLCKGTSKDEGPDVRFNEGYDIDALHAEYWAVRSEIRGSKRKAPDLIDSLVSWLSGVTPPVQVREKSRLVGLIVQYHHEHSLRTPTSFQMESMFNTVLTRLNPDDHEPMSYVELAYHMYGEKLRL